MQKSYAARFELVVFDWDGTLMDSEAHIVASMRCANAELLPRRQRELQLGSVQEQAAQSP